MNTMSIVQNYDNAKDRLRELVELFRDNIAQYKSAGYDEAKTRIDFIDKLFFELLGWDVRNVAGYSEQYRDVVREDKVTIDNRPKAPDYAFRVGKERKFFVEAKKPSVNIHDDIVPAYQVRRYGYTAKLPLCILTDFEEFAVYDTRIKPHHNDKASVGRIFYCKFNEYLDKFDFLVETFSKEAVLRGSFDRFAQSNKNKKGTSEVDQEILAMVEQWRIDLAKTIAKHNPTLSSLNLNSAVQRIVDRVLFLRIAEDRRIERYEELLDVAQAKDIYAGLHRLFVRADEKYNAGLFKQEDWLADIVVPDKVLAPIIKGLYYPISPYAFSVLPIEILGSIYERFLGKTIVLSPSHVAKVEEKPEVRKAGGVFYTPQYIVDYIVAETVGRKLKSDESKRTKTLPTLSIIDPACGSGSFLVGAYTFLLDEYLAFYSGSANLKSSLKKGVIYEVGIGSYLLSIEEKQRILLSNIFGVDIDPIAVEVTKLSLYLKLLENETDESANLLFKYTDLKMLPNLEGNIRCGNSLIGSDFYRNKDMPLFGEEEIRRINAFDWQKEFPTIFESGEFRVESGKRTASHQRKLAGNEHPATNVTGSRGGFDCVIGNPPWGQKAAKFSTEEKDYFAEKFPAASVGILDTSRFFIEQSIHLLNENSIWGQVLPDIILLKNYESTRKFLLDNMVFHTIDHWGKAFQQVNLEACTITGQKQGRKGKVRITIRHKDETKTVRKISQMVFSKLPGYKFNLYLTDEAWSILQKLSGLNRFGDLFIVREGIHSGNVRNKLFVDKKLNNKCKKLIFGRDEVQRYFLQWNGKWVHYTKEYFQPNDYAGLGKPEYFETPKLIIRRTGDYVLACLDETGYYFSNNSFVCLPKQDGPDLKFYLGILDSRLMTWYYQTIQPRVGKMFAEIKINQINDFPIPPINLSDKKQKAKHDKLVSLVDLMLSVQEQLRAALSDSDRKTCTQRIEIIDAQIDVLVYELYGLTDEEIKIVEESI